MKNNIDIKKILNDLYALDPSLRNHEKELTKLIHAMAIKPEAPYDPTFAATLRTQLLTKLSTMTAGAASANRMSQRRTLADIFMAPQFRYVALAIAVVALASVTLVTLHPKSGNGTLAFNSAKQSITTVAPNAFGTLSALTTSQTGVTDTENSHPSTLTNGTAPKAQTAAVTPTMTTASVIARPIGNPVFPNVGYNSIKYKYVGDAFSQNQAQLNVLKQNNQSLSADQATAALESAGFGQVNLSSFSGLTMNTVTLSQNQSFGYTISIDLQGDTISIDQNYTEWPQNATTQLTASDIPSDSAIIATANQFLSAHGISTANYGTPQISPTNYAIPMGAAANTNAVTPASGSGVSASGGSAAVGAANMPMIPYYIDTKQVLYPLVVNGMNVYDTNGNAIGMNVTVNLRYNRVSSVYGLQNQSYQSSAYDAITNSNTIIAMAESTPSYPMIYNYLEKGAKDTAASDIVGSGDPGSVIIVRKLGTPTMAYEQMYQTDNNGQTAEFLIPAFAFPVLNSGTDGNIQPQIIMVPLISAFAQQNYGGIRPVPYMDSAPTPATPNSPSSAPKAQ